MIRKSFLILGLGFLLAGFGLQAHDEGHRPPSSLPPFGPHGGRYAKMTKHFAEIVVRGKTLKVFILEPDVKYVAEDASSVTAALALPGKKAVALKLTKAGDGYTATLDLPPGTRRAHIVVGCVLDGKQESGRVLYEP